MKFQVPQFIEVEDKIFGPLTLKQFIYLAGGGAAVFLLYISLPFFLFVLTAIPVAGLATALAFYKINNQPFIKFMENAFRHFRQNKIYIWKKEDKQIIARKILTEKTKKTTTQITTPATITKKKLEDLAWSLDIQSKTRD